MFAVRRGITGFAVLAVLVAGLSSAPAAPRAQRGAAADSDCTLTALARQALLDDVELGALNLGVSVNDRVATIWGAVPSEATASRAVECLRRVQGIARVVNQVSVEAPGDPLFDMLHQPGRPRPADRKTPAPAPAQTRTSLGPASLPTRTVGADARPVAVQTRPTAQAAALAETPVMPAVALPARPAGSPSRDLPQAIAAAQAKNPRLRHVRPEIQGGVVYLRGAVYGWDDLFSLAHAVAALPGVERVIIQDVRTIRP